MTPELASSMTRYALYFTPAPETEWWRAGCQWLGRDAQTDVRCFQPSVAGVLPTQLKQLTIDARRYGFHATLKAPFRLAPGFSEEHLLAMAEAFTATQRSLQVDMLQVQELGNFMALQPAADNNTGSDELGVLAMRCVSYFDLLRAAPTATELAKRRRTELNVRQEALLQRWGYQFTEEEYRFHLTLTDALDAIDEEAVYAIRSAAETCFSKALTTPMTVDALSIFREEEPGAPLTMWKRLPFFDRAATPSIPEPGRLFFVVGPSGVGKDTLLRWVKDNMPADSSTVFARRTITRAAHASEAHEVIEHGYFWQLAADGHFSMLWQANGSCYGIRRGIEAELQAGRDVVINGSREYVPQLRQSFTDACIIWIDAEPELIRQRIEARQREAGPALLRRMERVSQFNAPETDDIYRIDNSGPVEVAGRRLLEILAPVQK